MIAAPLAAALLVLLVVPPILTARTGRAPAGSAPSVAIPAAIPRTRSLPRWRRRSRIAPGDIAAWCDDLSRGLRHGSTLRAVLVGTIPDDDALAGLTARLRHRLDRGAAVVEACDGWSEDLSADASPGADLLAPCATLLAAITTLGGNAAEPIDRFAVTMRQRTSDDLERESNSAQARMSARVLTIVPLAVLALLLATDDGVRAVMATPAGAMVAIIGLTLNAVGGVWMHRIADGSAHGSANR
ncbi:type II secretion system F family protein [Ilumatobacter sp.]|uniref:type II secretion system F family protein n=1 Tax=Ilumatobacter sp. TaxID=1967498 RepID=UPI003C56EAE8